VTFNVVASGFQLSYQWSFNATNILGATNSSLTLTNVQPDDAGNYAVQVTNLFGSTLSSNAVLTVLVPPTITTQPTNVTALAGNTAVFTVAADGTAPFSYQWAFNNTNLEDATNLTLTLTNVTMDQAGTYSVIVTNLAGGVTSSNAVLNIYSSAASTLNGASLDTDNDIQFTVAGVPGFNYAVLASTNMMDWVPLTTNISPFVFIDTNTSGNPQQFYRTLYMP
jgi:Immunoglobulin domain/Immunoglobulin I-set domain